MKRKEKNRFFAFCTEMKEQRKGFQEIMWLSAERSVGLLCGSYGGDGAVLKGAERQP